VRGHRLLVTAIAVLVLDACGAGSTTPGPAPLLRDAKTSVDSASGLHFTLTSQNVAGTGPLITGGEGNAHRPDGFSGSLSVVDSGFTITVNVVSTGGVFYAQTPLSTAYVRTDPSTYGFGDPGQLLDPSHGLSSLLAACTGATMRDSDRLNGELLDEVACSIPGALVATLLTSADASQPVQATIGVADSNHQLRRVTLLGPFFDKARPSTFTVVLDKYGENVTITPPAG
jgi:LppX_LprAFG lipoprotein